MFLDNRGTNQERLFDEWREAARVVGERWSDFLGAPAECRRATFASYVAALDAEELAATSLGEANARTTRPVLPALRRAA